MEQQLAAAERKGITLTATLPDRPLRIHHDPPRIGQVVTNLVGNALKFTPRGGAVRVSARLDADGGARIEVVDTGVGIDPAELPQIFDRFYRGSEANEATRHRVPASASPSSSPSWTCTTGRSRSRAGVGRGTRFTVTLPRDPREAHDPRER